MGADHQSAPFDHDDDDDDDTLSSHDKLAMAIMMTRMTHGKCGSSFFPFLMKFAIFLSPHSIMDEYNHDVEGYDE